ncbi:MAG: MAPEG family protein [Pseudomonadota bacterium]
MSQQQALLLPVFLHVLMTMGLGVATALARRRAVLQGKVRLKDVALEKSAWPDEVKKLGNNFDNQFQMPMLWYAGVAFTLVLNAADGLLVGLSWAFLVLRVGHSCVHVGRNIVIRRFFIFFAAALVLMLYWLWLAYKVFV